MEPGILALVDEKIQKFKKDHGGEAPLYIIVSPYEADNLFDEVKRAGGHPETDVVTIYKGSKIIKHDALNKGDLRLSNELPEMGG